MVSPPLAGAGVPPNSVDVEIAECPPLAGAGGGCPLVAETSPFIPLQRGTGGIFMTVVKNPDIAFWCVLFNTLLMVMLL